MNESHPVAASANLRFVKHADAIGGRSDGAA